MPEYGKQVTIRNKTGSIVGITGGRVRVDFNHPLAGRTLKYTFKVVENVEKLEDKVRAIIDMGYLGAKLEDFHITIDGDTVSIQVPDTCKYDQRWFMAKYMIVNDIQESVGIETVKLIESYQKTDAQKMAAGEDAKPMDLAKAAEKSDGSKDEKKEDEGEASGDASEEQKDEQDQKAEDRNATESGNKA